MFDRWPWILAFVVALMIEHRAFIVRWWRDRQFWKRPIAGIPASGDTVVFRGGHYDPGRTAFVDTTKTTGTTWEWTGGTGGAWGEPGNWAPKAKEFPGYGIGHPYVDEKAGEIRYRTFMADVDSGGNPIS